MSTKIRLQRHGRKKRAFFHIVVADSRAPRDGRFIEKIGSYNPITNPATIELNLDKAVQWLNNGAEPSDTCRAILSYKGAIYKKHLQGGVKKGALTQEQADAKFAAWLESKQNKIESKREKITGAKTSLRNEFLKQESARKEAVAAKVLAKTSVLADEVVEAPVAETVETPAAEVVETPAAEVVETPAAEVVETPAAEVVETPAAEIDETPSAEAEEPAAE